jgi:hypothetical protein
LAARVKTSSGPRRRGTAPHTSHGHDHDEKEVDHSSTSSAMSSSSNNITLFVPSAPSIGIDPIIPMSTKVTSVIGSPQPPLGSPQPPSTSPLPSRGGRRKRRTVTLTGEEPVWCRLSARDDGSIALKWKADIEDTDSDDD